MGFVRATEAAEDAAKLLSAAVARLTVALAVVKGPDEEDEAEAATKN